MPTQNPAILDVPFFSQTALKDAQTPDGKPANYTLGNSNIPLWSDGCGVASLAMVFRYHGVETDLVGMNGRLKSANAFSGALLAWSESKNFVAAGAHQHFATTGVPRTRGYCSGSGRASYCVP
jgi:hypothetical protein